MTKKLLVCCALSFRYGRDCRMRLPNRRNRRPPAAQSFPTPRPCRRRAKLYVPNVATGATSGRPILLRADYDADTASARHRPSVLAPAARAPLRRYVKRLADNLAYQIPSIALTSSEAIVAGSHGGVKVISTLAFFTPSTART